MRSTLWATTGCDQDDPDRAGLSVAGTLPGLVERAVETVDGVDHCQIDLVWDPPVDQGRMSEAAQLELGMM